MELFQANNYWPGIIPHKPMADIFRRPNLVADMELRKVEPLGVLA